MLQLDIKATSISTEYKHYL